VAERLDPATAPIGFAHRGASAHAPENTIEAFTLALRLGATGLETDAWLTADREVVLVHDGEIRTGLRKRAIIGLARRALPSYVPTLAELYEACGTDVPLSIDVKDPAAAAAIVGIARNAGGDALANLHLCSPSWEEAASWRRLSDDVQLVDSTRLRKIKEGPERRGAILRDNGINVINMHVDDWNGGFTTLFHRFGRRAFAWDAQFERQLDSVLAMGIDGLFSDHVDRMVEAIARVVVGR
jgi:glycerophosphoryl diester phosphodiesterase